MNEMQPNEMQPNEMLPSEKQPYETVQSFEFVDGAARIYRSQDGLHEVVIADNQAAQSDQLRHFHELDKNRLAPNAVPERGAQIWAEDVFAAIKRLPNPYLVTQVVLQNKWPADAGTGSPSETSGSQSGALPAVQSFPTGRLVVPMLMDRSYLAETLLLAWTRLLWFRYDALTHFFRYATFLERNGYFIGRTTGDAENWAVHLVGGLLSGDEGQFASFIAQAPLRAMILAGALQRSLDDSEEDHPHLEKRLQTISKETLGKAQEKLISILKDSSPANAASGDADFAFTLLLLLGTEPQLASLGITVANLANEPHTNAALQKLGAMSTLKVLNLSQTLISREGTGFLANLLNLRKLDLSDTKIMSSSLAPLRSLSRLEELNLSGTQINDTALPSLACLIGLRKLDITDTPLVASKAVLQEHLSGCQVIG